MLLLDQDEHIVLEVRKHWFIALSGLFGFVLLAVLPPVLLLSGLLDRVPSSVSALFTGRGALFIYFLWLLYLWIGGFLFWTDYYLDVLVLTNKRIIEFEQRGLFGHEVSSFRLDKVQDVTTESYGLIPHLLKFGNVQIQTASGGREFFMRGIANPEVVKQVILSAHHEAVGKAGDIV